MRSVQMRTGIAARHPVTGQVLRVANSKVVETVGSLSVGTNLVPISVCVDFLVGNCAFAEQCRNLHVIGLSSHGWPLIHLPREAECDAGWSDGVTAHDAGWLLQAYDTTLTYLVDVPSHLALRTAGSVAFALQYNAVGPRGRHHTYLCPDYNALGTCELMGACPYIHATAEVTAMSRSIVHVNYESLKCPSQAAYARLPAGKTLRVVDPNVRTQVMEVASEHVLRTQGSERHYSSGRGRLIHCAHFYLKKLCRRGPDCYFAHVLLPREEERSDGGSTEAKGNDEENIEEVLLCRAVSDGRDAAWTHDITPAVALRPCDGQLYSFDPYMLAGSIIRTVRPSAP